MIRAIFAVSAMGVFFLSGCSSTNTQLKHSQLAVSQAELSLPKWQNLERFPARYPVVMVKNSTHGCATVEYVITPSYQIEDLRVISETKSNFGRVAKKAVQSWHWDKLPAGIIDKPVKTQTRFEFCLAETDEPCVENQSKFSCEGEDVLHTFGSVIKKMVLTR